jgi:hypothetical protein
MPDPVTWSPAPDAMEIAETLIEEHHPHLMDVAYRIVFRSRARKHGKERVVLGTAEIISGRFAFFVMTDEEVAKQAETFENPYKMFWMEIASDTWEELTLDQRIALVDHELCHFGIHSDEDKDEPEMIIVPHDIEEFNDIARRHGLWKSDVETFAAIVAGFEGA